MTPAQQLAAHLREMKRAAGAPPAPLRARPTLTARAAPVSGGEWLVPEIRAAASRIAGSLRVGAMLIGGGLIAAGALVAAALLMRS